MGYRQLLQFDTDYPEFVRGFEAGRIWSLLRMVVKGDVDGEELDGLPFHAANTEMVLRMLEALELVDDWRAEFVDETWMVLRQRESSTS